MSIASFPRWGVLLAASLMALSAPILHLPPTIAASLQGRAVTTMQVIPVQAGLLAQRSRLQRIRFAPGEDSATIKSSVVNGSRDRYLLGAQKGQTMTVRIVSLEDNAVFDVAAPPDDDGQRQTLQQEAFTWSSTLPATGDYQIVVGSTRGNASYRLQVTIR